MLAQNSHEGFYIVGGVLFIIALVLWILPNFIALKRGHQNAAAIIALDLLLGWTFLGWVAALVWSLTAVEKRSQYAPSQPAPNQQAATNWPQTWWGCLIIGILTTVIGFILLFILGLLISR